MALTFVMQPPSIEDIHSIVVIEHPSVTIEEVQAVSEKWGLNIRTIFSVLRMGNDNYQRNFVTQIKNLSEDAVAMLAASPSDASLNQSYSIVTTFRTHPFSDKQSPQYMCDDGMINCITSQHVWHTLVHQRVLNERVKLSELYTLLKCDRGRSFRGVAFEAFSHVFLADGKRSVALRKSDNEALTNLTLIAHKTHIYFLGDKVSSTSHDHIYSLSMVLA
ncbi:hypothetical protein B0H19DRAFT_1379322 [Mycena capillaripes]|nr:hypothetical protein B0H19DRAFT_1379322 [Mycena capillaripes]